MPTLNLTSIPDFGKTKVKLSLLNFLHIENDKFALLLKPKNNGYSGHSIIIELAGGKFLRGVICDKKLFGFCRAPEPRHYICYGPSGIIIDSSDSNITEDSSIVDMGLTFKFGEVTNAVKMEETLYILGMSRQVYSGSTGNWKFVSEETLDTSIERCVFSSFFACAEHAGKKLFSGAEGETWTFESGTWSKLDTPFNVDINDIISAGDGSFILGGQMGVLWQYRDELWEDLSHPEHTGEINRLRLFGSNLILTIDGRVYSAPFFHRDNPGLEIRLIEYIKGNVISMDATESTLFVLTHEELWSMDEKLNAAPLSLLQMLEGIKIAV